MRWVPVVLLFFFLSAVSAPAATIDVDTRWEGELRFSETVRVEKGATLTVAPGSRIVFSGGGLEVAGALVAEDCRFEGEGWSGLELKGTTAATRLEKVVVRGAKTGVFIGGGSPAAKELTLVENDIGMEIKLKSSARIENSRFENNHKVGLFIKDDSTPVVKNCSFVANGRYGAYIHRSKPDDFHGNIFRENATGLAVSHLGSSPRIHGCRFEDNTLGVLVDRAATPILQGNRWQGNTTGLKLHRRSDATVVGNLFRENELAVLVSFSSYPELRGNDFLENRMALRLEYQSSKWEAQRGADTRATEIARQGAFAGEQGQQVQDRQRDIGNLEGIVRASDNWWGENGTRELQEIGADGNPTFIDDGRDRPEFEEQGQRYPLDSVEFMPWSRRSNLEEAS